MWGDSTSHFRGVLLAHVQRPLRRWCLVAVWVSRNTHMYLAGAVERRVPDGDPVARKGRKTQICYAPGIL